MEEQNTEDFGDFGRYCFVSCWTKDGRESIPLWNMYTPQMSGVRIRLPEYPFDTEILPANKEGVKEDITYDKGLLSLQQNNDVIVMPYRAQLISVTYTEDESLLNPKNRDRIRSNITITTENMGEFKRASWSFQKEYRYKLHILPFTLKELDMMLRTGIDQIVKSYGIIFFR
ncbi:DUF2971 domain-containing protein [Bacillus sp. B-jedd]|uniref:DUF2971 domain-containing protein n=1 Tax=Bacillus sp. B-jedd TaxID=1476857 RepID=UPI0005156B79|nr:DUF2971 domain-containing protein [Bacillus sp. B-jedd]CEG27142.1 hypothetical protein BN1002_01998 [Bacillus sp. B-jedd]